MGGGGGSSDARRVRLRRQRQQRRERRGVGRRACAAIVSSRRTSRISAPRRRRRAPRTRSAPLPHRRRGRAIRQDVHLDPHQKQRRGHRAHRVRIARRRGGAPRHPLERDAAARHVAADRGRVLQAGQRGQLQGGARAAPRDVQRAVGGRRQQAVRDVRRQVDGGGEGGEGAVHRDHQRARGVPRGAGVARAREDEEEGRDRGGAEVLRHGREDRHAVGEHARRPGAVDLGQGRRLQARREAARVRGAAEDVGARPPRQGVRQVPRRRVRRRRQALPRGLRPRPRAARRRAPRPRAHRREARQHRARAALPRADARARARERRGARGARVPLAQRGARQGGDGSAQEGVRPQPGAALRAQHVGEPLLLPRRVREGAGAGQARLRPLRLRRRPRRFVLPHGALLPRAGRLQVGAPVVHPGDGRIPHVRAAHLRARPDAPQVWG